MNVSQATPPERALRVVPFVALLILAVHVTVLLAHPIPGALSLVSNLCELAAGLLAALACALAARRMRNFGRYFWMLVTTGFSIWCFAQIICTYYESVLHAPLDAPWPSDIIFFLSMAPLFMTVFIDPEKGFDREQWPRIFDFLQVIVVFVALYLFTFQTPGYWQHGWGALAKLSWTPEFLRDLSLMVTLGLSAAFAEQKLSRRLYGLMAIFAGVYFSCETPFLYLQSTKQLRSGTLWDLCWTIPFLVTSILAATSSFDQSLQATASKAALNKRLRREWGLIHVVSLIFPLVVLLLAAGIADVQLATAIVLVLVSFACSVGRILVAESQQAESARALQERNALLKSVFEGTGDAFFIKDLKGRYIIVNQTFADLLGRTPEQIVGKSNDEFFDPETSRELSKQDKEVSESGTAKSFEHCLTLSGDSRVFLTQKAPRRDANGNIVGVVSSVRDITEYRLIEAHLRQSQKMEAIGTLAGGVAHDFNNLLTVINGYSSILSDSLINDAKLRGHVDQIQKAAERAMSLTRQLLAFSRKQTIQPSVLKLNLVISGMEKLLHRLIGEDILISAQLADDLGTVLADAGQMEQVILNLAVNARDAMPQGGQLTFETRNVELGDGIAAANNMKPGRYVEFVVKDNGIGMDMHVQTRLFEPFFTTKPAGKGTGLGLSTVYGILKQANGNITFTSQPGHGTTFRIYLPRTDSVPAGAMAPPELNLVLDGRESVLVVEDDLAVCNLIRAVLTSHGYSVICPARPQDAESVFDQHAGKFDLLLSDVVMPEISGPELAKRLRAKNPNLKVLLMSGYLGDSITRKGIEEQEFGFLQKPFAPFLLAKKVREILDGSRVRES